MLDVGQTLSQTDSRIVYGAVAALWATIVGAAGLLFRLIFSNFNDIKKEFAAFRGGLTEHEALDNTRFANLAHEAEVRYENFATAALARHDDLRKSMEKWSDNATGVMTNVQLAVARIEARIPDRRSHPRE